MTYVCTCIDSLETKHSFLGFLFYLKDDVRAHPTLPPLLYPHHKLFPLKKSIEKIIRIIMHECMISCLR